MGEKAFGLAILVTVFGTASRNAGQHPFADPIAQAHHAMTKGVETAFVVAAIFMASTLAVSIVAIRGTTVPHPAVSAAQPIIAAQ